MVLLFAVTAGLVIAPSALAQPTPEMVPPQLKEYRIERGISEDAMECIECHTK